MTLITRNDFPASLLPTSAPTSPAQVGTLAQLMAYSARSLQAHTPRGVTTKVLLSNGNTQEYRLISVGEGENTDGKPVLVIQSVVLLDWAFRTGGLPEWAYAKPWDGATLLSGAYKA
jgi:hypothetical protein